MSTKKTNQNTNANQQHKPKAKTHKQSGNDNNQSNMDKDVNSFMTPSSWLKIKEFFLPPRKHHM